MMSRWIRSFVANQVLLLLVDSNSVHKVDSQGFKKGTVPNTFLVGSAGAHIDTRSSVVEAGTPTEHIHFQSAFICTFVQLVLATWSIHACVELFCTSLL